MRFTTTLILLIVSFTICSAQAPVNGVITISPKYAVGDTLNYVEINAAEDSEMPGLENVMHVTNVQIIVKEQIDTLLYCTWKYGKSELLGLDTFDLDNYTSSLLKLNDNLSIDFKIDLKGNYVGLGNYQATKAALTKQFDFIINNMSGVTDTAMISSLRAQLEKTLGDEVTMTATYFQNLLRLFRFNNLTLHEDSMLMIFTELPSPFGSANLPAIQECYIDGIEDGIISIVTETNIDDEKLNDFLSDLFSSIEGAEGKFNEEDFTGLELYDEVLLEYDYTEKHILYLEFSRYTTIKEREKIQYRVLLDKKMFEESDLK